MKAIENAVATIQDDEVFQAYLVELVVGDIKAGI
jgi:hypothetical protein